MPAAPQLAPRRPAADVAPDRCALRYGGRTFVRLAEGQSLAGLVAQLGLAPRRAAALGAINPQIPRDARGRPAPRAGSWLLVPDGWIHPEKFAGALGEIPGLINECGKDFFGVQYWAFYDEDGSFLECTDNTEGAGISCPPGYEKNYSYAAGDTPEGRICVKKPAQSSAQWGQGCGDDLGAGRRSGYIGADGECMSCGEGRYYSEAAQGCADLPVSSDQWGKGCGGDAGEGLTRGYIAADGLCTSCGEGRGYDEAAQGCRDLTASSSSGGDEGGGSGDGGGASDWWGSDTPTEDKPKKAKGAGAGQKIDKNPQPPPAPDPLWKRALAFFSQPAVLIPVVVGAAAGAAVLTSKKKG